MAVAVAVAVRRKVKGGEGGSGGSVVAIFFAEATAVDIGQADEARKCTAVNAWPDCIGIKAWSARRARSQTMLGMNFYQNVFIRMA